MLNERRERHIYIIQIILWIIRNSAESARSTARLEKPWGKLAEGRIEICFHGLSPQQAVSLQARVAEVDAMPPSTASAWTSERPWIEMFPSSRVLR